MFVWDKYWETTLDAGNPPFWKWFVGGKLNVFTTASIATWLIHEQGGAHVCTGTGVAGARGNHFQELYVRVNELAALLRNSPG